MARSNGTRNSVANTATIELARIEEVEIISEVKPVESPVEAESTVKPTEEVKPVESPVEFESDVTEENLVKTFQVQEKCLPNMEGYILRYVGFKVFVMPSMGTSKRLLGYMTRQGLRRNVAIPLSADIEKAIAMANRLWSPAHKQDQDKKKHDRMMEARKEFAKVFGF